MIGGGRETGAQRAAAGLDGGGHEPFQRVLVGTDLSPRSTLALQRVQHFSFAQGAAVTIVHVLPPRQPRRPTSDIEAIAKLRLSRHATRLERGLARLGRPHVDVRILLVSGDAPVELVRIAQGTSAEVLVIGRRGAGRVKDLLLGSTAERVIHECPVPILVATRQPTGAYTKPLIALVGEEGSRWVMQVALRMLPTTSARLDVVTAIAVPMEGWLWAGWISTREIRRLRAVARRRARQELARVLAGIPGRVIMRHGDARRVILDVAGKRDSDLIVVGTHARPGMVRFRLGSVAAHVVRHAACDVLVVRLPGTRY